MKRQGDIQVICRDRGQAISEKFLLIAGRSTSLKERIAPILIARALIARYTSWREPLVAWEQIDAEGSSRVRPVWDQYSSHGPEMEEV
jgi:hypothetical protein